MRPWSDLQNPFFTITRIVEVDVFGIVGRPCNATLFPVPGFQRIKDGDLGFETGAGPKSVRLVRRLKLTVAQEIQVRCSNQLNQP